MNKFILQTIARGKKKNLREENSAPHDDTSSLRRCERLVAPLGRVARLFFDMSPACLATYPAQDVHRQFGIKQDRLDLVSG